jgi:hypothetical protein
MATLYGHAIEARAQLRRPLGWPNARLAKEAAKTAVVAFALVWNFPVLWPTATSGLAGVPHLIPKGVSK